MALPPNPQHPVPCPWRLALCLRPEIRGREHADDFEISEVFPMNHPASQQFQIHGPHDLKAASPARLHPACVVDDAFGEHSATALEAFTNPREAARLEILDDHEDHGPQSTLAWDHMKLASDAHDGRPVVGPLRAEGAPNPPTSAMQRFARFVMLHRGSGNRTCHGEGSDLYQSGVGAKG